MNSNGLLFLCFNPAPTIALCEKIELSILQSLVCKMY